VPHRVGNAADSGGDHGQARSHGLQYADRQILVVGRQHVHRCFREEPRFLLARHPPREAQALLHADLARQAADLFNLPAARGHQPHVRAHCRDLGQRPDQVVDALALADLAEEQDAVRGTSRPGPLHVRLQGLDLDHVRDDDHARQGSNAGKVGATVLGESDHGARAFERAAHQPAGERPAFLLVELLEGGAMQLHHSGHMDEARQFQEHRLAPDAAAHRDVRMDQSDAQSEQQPQERSERAQRDCQTTRQARAFVRNEQADRQPREQPAAAQVRDGFGHSARGRGAEHDDRFHGAMCKRGAAKDIERPMGRWAHCPG